MKPCQAASQLLFIVGEASLLSSLDSYWSQRYKKIANLFRLTGFLLEVFVVEFLHVGQFFALLLFQIRAAVVEAGKAA